MIEQHILLPPPKKKSKKTHTHLKNNANTTNKPRWSRVFRKVKQFVLQ